VALRMNIVVRDVKAIVQPRQCAVLTVKAAPRSADSRFAARFMG
jgi:hypothetical protein